MQANLLPDDFCPVDRAQAAALANERGCAWYMPHTTCKYQINFVQKDTPLSDAGEAVLYGNAWSKREVLEIVRELNRAHLLGFRCGQQST